MFALCNTFARLGGLVSPLLQNWTSHFMGVFGCLYASAFVLTVAIRETKGRGMVDRVQDFAKKEQAPLAEQEQ